MHAVVEKGPITCPIPGFSILRTLRPSESQRSVGDLELKAGIFFKSPTGSIHAVISPNNTYGYVNTLRIAEDNTVRPGRVMFTTSIAPESEIKIYQIPKPAAARELRCALENMVAEKVLGALFAHKEVIAPASITLGKEKRYSAYLENVGFSLAELKVSASRSDITEPGVTLGVELGGLVAGTINFGWAAGDNISLRSEIIRTITADASIRQLPDYVERLEGIVHAAGIFNAVVQAQNAL